MTAENGDEALSEQGLDIPKLLADIAHGARVGTLVAEMRPARDLLGAQLVNLVDLCEAAISIARQSQQFVEMQEMIDSRRSDEDVVDLDQEFAWNPWWPTPDSPATHDIDVLVSDSWPSSFLHRPPARDFGRPLFLVRRLMEASVDHLRAIGVLMQSDGVSRSPLALARVAAEAAARACHIVDPEATPSQRMRRAINFELEILEEKRKAAKREGDGSQLKDAEDESSRLLGAAIARGAKRSKDHGKFLDPYVGAGELIDAVLQREHRSTYHFLSGYVHSQEDEGARLAMGLADGDGNPHQGMYLALHCFGAIVVFSEACRRVGLYTG